MYFTTDMRDQLQRKATEAQARQWARQWGHPAPPPGVSYVDRYFPPARSGEHGAGASWDAPPDPAALAKAERAARAYLSAGYGRPVRADGRVPCGDCVKCDLGAYGRCAKALAPAEARLRADQARDADRTAAAILAAELAMLHVELSAALD